MRILLLGTATIALSGCSFGGHSKTDNYNQIQTGGDYIAQSAPSCTTGNCLSRWNLEGGIGPSIGIGGTAITGDEAHNIAGNSYDDVSMSKVYDTGLRAELGGSYALSPNNKITLIGHYDTADSGGPIKLGEIAGEDLTGQLSDYKSFGAEAGLRHYFGPTKGLIFHSIRPYVEGRIGVDRVSGIDLEDVKVGGADFAEGTEFGFYNKGWVTSATGLVGVETPIAKYMTLALETGIRQTTGLGTDNSGDIATDSALAGLNNGGARTTIPVNLRGRYRF